MMKIIISAALVCSSSSAWAILCSELDTIRGNEWSKIEQYKARIGQINAEVPPLNQTKHNAATALPGYQDSVKICAMSNDKKKTDVGALGLAMEIINHIIVFDQVLQKRLLKIIESGKDAPDWNLSALLKNYADKAALTPGDRLQILSMAKAFDLLTEKDQTWRAEERNWLESVKTNIAAVQTLGPRLQKAYDETIAKDKNLDESCKRSVEQVTLFNQQIANADKRLGETQQETHALNVEISRSTGIIENTPACDLPSLIERTDSSRF